jgi:hypothetical protein
MFWRRRRKSQSLRMRMEMVSLERVRRGEERARPVKEAVLQGRLRLVTVEALHLLAVVAAVHHLFLLP